MIFRKQFLLRFISGLILLSGCVIPDSQTCSDKSTDRGLSGVVAQKTHEILRPGVLLTLLKCENSGETEINPGDVLTQRDRYAIRFTPETPAYVYIFQVDSQKKKERLFPNLRYSGETNPVISGKSFRIPPKGKWLWLDNNTGEEQVILIARSEPLADPEQICQMVIEGHLDESYSKDRKMAGTRKELPYKINLDVSELLIRKTVFMHR